jgi:hypothetical protein
MFNQCAEVFNCWFAGRGALPRSAELQFGKGRRNSPVRADSEIGAPISAMLHEGSSARMRPFTAPPSILPLAILLL